MREELIVFFTSMTPLIDMKLGIPLGIELGLSATTATVFGIAGTLAYAILGLAVLGPISNFMMKHSTIMNNLLTRLFAKTRHKHSEKFKRYGALFLMLFVIAPLPGSGPGAGTVIAFVFGVEFWKAIGLLSLGGIGSGILVAGGTTSIIALLHTIF